MNPESYLLLWLFILSTLSLCLLIAVTLEWWRDSHSHVTFSTEILIAYRIENDA